MKKHSAEIVLKALLMGLEVKNKEGTRFKFMDTNMGKRDLCVRGEVHAFRGEELEHTVEEVWFGANMSFTGFIEMCENIPGDEIFLIGSNTALNEMKG